MNDMALTITAEIRGLDVVLGVLVEMKRSLRNRIIRKAITKASQPIMKSMKALAPRDSGLLRRSIGRRTKTTRRGEVVAVIGPRSKPSFKQQVRVGGKGKGKRMKGGRLVIRNPVRYAHLVEFGTRHSRAKPFMRPAFDANQRQARQMIEKIVWDELRRVKAT
jgi:HK97 gp10 family phage protein